MTTITDEQKAMHMRATIQAGLDSAWIKRVGPTGDPGEWFFVEFLEMPHAKYQATHCGWRWYFKFHVDEEDPSPEERALLHSLQELDWSHGCDDERGFTYIWDDDGDFPQGFDTKAKPEVPDVVVQAAILLSG
jgi:hypothetical protein